MTVDDLGRETSGLSPHEIDPALVRLVMQQMGGLMPKGPAWEAEILASSAVQFIEVGGHAIEQAIPLLQRAIGSVAPEEDPRSWCRWQHNLGDAFMQRPGGTRAANVEAAIRAFHAALKGRDGSLRVDTLHHLAQALRQRASGRPEENHAEAVRAIDEAAQLLQATPDPGRQARNALENGRLAGDAGRNEDAERSFKEALRLADHTLRPHVEDARAQWLCHLALKDPARRHDAIAAAQALYDTVKRHEDRRLRLIARERLRKLKVAVEPLSAEDVQFGELRFLKEEFLERDTLSTNVRRMLEARVESEERAAFQEWSGAVLVHREADLAPFWFRLATEAARSGQSAVAFAHLAHMGAWRLRRLLRWGALARRNDRVQLFFRASLLEASLDAALAEAELYDGINASPPSLSGAVDENPLRRFLSGDADEVVLSTPDLLLLASWPKSERASAAAAIREGIASNIRLGLAELGPASIVEFLAAPTLTKAELETAVEAGEGMLLLVGLGKQAGLAALWRDGRGTRHSEATFFPEARTGEPPMTVAIQRVVQQLSVSGVRRLTICRRGTLARDWKLLKPAADMGITLVHVAGFDRPVPLRPSPRRSKRLVWVLDEQPDTRLAAFVPVLSTLRRIGYSVLPATPPDTSLNAAILDAQGILVVGHGDGPEGPLGGGIGTLPVVGLQELPLQGCRWGLSLSCSSGETRTRDQTRWDHDPGIGAAERLMIAGCEAAADCLTPVPVITAALIAETFAALEAAGSPTEESFADARRRWRRFFTSRVDPLAELLATWAAPEEEALDWFANEINRERAATLGSVDLVTPAAIFATLGKSEGEKRISIAKNFLQLHVDACDQIRWSTRA